MSTTRLPEIPPAQRFKWDQEQDDTFGDMVGPVPDGEWMRVADARAYGLAVWQAAMEQAAQAVTIAGGGPWTNPRNPAAVIRSLPLPEQGGPQ